LSQIQLIYGVDARKHVNLMCLATGVPLIESGTAGLLGQAGVHIKGKTECFECTPKTKPKVYPVCTIRSTPSQPIHCIVWSKSFLFAQMFGDIESEATTMTEEGADKEELTRLKADEDELKRLREQAGHANYAEDIFDKMFHRDVARFLLVDEMWTDRRKPTPLLSADMLKLVDTTNVTGIDIDHQVWSLRRCYDVFVTSCNVLGQRALEDKLEFDKDDQVMMDFVTACSNLRSHIFGIQLKTRFEIKEMAGNIIPAIATTNAIIAGLVVLMAKKILQGKADSIKTTFLAYNNPRRLLHNEQLQPPSPRCSVCSMTFRHVRLDLNSHTLNDIVSLAKNQLKLSEVAVMDRNGRLLFDEDFDDNVERTLADMNMKSGASLTIVEEDDGMHPVHLSLIHDAKFKGELLVSEGDAIRTKSAGMQVVKKRKLDEEEEVKPEQKKTRIDVDLESSVIQFD
jgi:ubiquitin-like 1-activating enzyme E1 B